MKSTDFVGKKWSGNARLVHTINATSLVDVFMPNDDIVEGSKSSTCDVTSGVPVLGPILFLIYINDIITNIQSEIRLFADDIFLYKTIKTSDDHQILQNDLNLLTKWSTDWLMDFNISKCKILQITTHHNKSS